FLAPLEQAAATTTNVKSSNPFKLCMPPPLKRLACLFSNTRACGATWSMPHAMLTPQIDNGC
ncbi:MAG: hypothetical protein QNJ02_06300, partial [Desulfobacterales bacterium]|nr:hypothetical protein [Desulfobacterales bacterium]